MNSEKIKFYEKTKKVLEVQAQGTTVPILRLTGVYLDIEVGTFLSYKLTNTHFSQ